MSTQNTSPADQNRYRTFEDLEVYQVAREFRKSMYRVNRRLPSLEKFELGSQIRRAAVSLTNNIAEGHGRFHYLEQIKFCLNSRGSLEELLDDLNICRDESYLPRAESLGLREESPAYGLTEDQLDELLADQGGPPASTLQPFNASTV